MNYRTLDPRGAHALLEERTGWIYLDVRTVEEFHAGHPSDAYNVPVALRDPARGMSPNAEFAAIVVQALTREAKLVVGCAAGGRSMHACELLEAAGFKNLVNVAGGFAGGRDEGGRAVAGWQACGLPCSSTPRTDRTYTKLRESTRS